MILCPLPGVPRRHFRITQKFGERPETYGQFGLPGHNGIDFAPLKAGTTTQKVFAPHEGIITKLAFDPHGYGLHVEITSLPYNTLGHRRCSTLAHFASLRVKLGQWVGMCDELGIMGKSGFADGIHTHWTYKVKDEAGGTVGGQPGYNGALDIIKNTRLWLDQSL